ncbi:MAG: hypothetical protein P8M80_06360, partial [Pirellulaceae bacterium]|nr:hypothetical protein [Pirellulaceae bacterium]
EEKSDTKKSEMTASTPEEFAQSVVTLLAANEANQFIEFVFPAKEELLSFFLKTVPADERDNGIPTEIEKGFDLKRNGVLNSFAKVSHELAGDGCDWNQAQFVRAKYEIEKRRGFSWTDVEVTFSAGRQTYEIILDDCLLVNGRWYTLDKMRSATKKREHPVEAEQTHPHSETGVKRSQNKQKDAQEQKIKKLSTEEATSLLADELGRWKVTGKNMPVGGDVEPFDFMMEARWMVKGKSIEFTFSPLVNGERVRFVGHREYDPQEGLFIWRTKGEGFPEASGRDQYDPATKTYRGRYIHADGAKETKTCELVGKDKMLVTSQFEFDGKVVFTREGVFTRLPESGDKAKK